jgi:hypothetical protein
MWQDNIREIGINRASWIRLAQESFCESGDEPSGYIKQAVV